MKYLLIFVSLFFLVSFSTIEAQNIGIGIEAQKYAAGHILGGRIDIGIGDYNNLNVRVGYNFARHEDFGVHQDETGGGWGGSLGFRHYTSPDKSALFLGVRTDLWFNTIDWIDFIGQVDEVSGTTDIVVLQPTIEIGYGFLLNDRILIAPSAAFGWEWNIKVDGADVGEGAILLGGVQVSYRF
ncbi:MAG: hypothetical protein R3E32_18605 [Chitinophagales bacterium]